jgi:hypothetical protein
MALIRCNVVVRESITAADLITWVYRDQKAHLMSGQGLHLPEGADEGAHDPEDYHGGWSADGCAALARRAAMGALIPDTGHLQRYALHPDAETVHSLVVERSRPDPLGATLLLRHGRRGDAPDEGETARPEPVRRLDREGGERIVEDATLPGGSHLEQRWRLDRKTGRREKVWVEVPHPFCPLRYWPDGAELAHSRLEYRTWWRALRAVAGALPPLRRWRVTGLGAARPAETRGLGVAAEEDRRPAARCRSGDNPAMPPIIP